MGSEDEVVDVDFLERRLLHPSASNVSCEAEDEVVVYTASFQEMENNYIKYQTAQWILYSLLLTFAWGIGLLMLLYIPIRRYVLRRDFQSRKLYVTPNAIVYKVARPVPFPCFGSLKKEKHVLLPLVADIAIEQGYLQFLYGVYSIRIENAGVRRPASDDVQIQGIANPRDFRKAVLTCLSNMRSETFNHQVCTNEDLPHSSSNYTTGAWVTPSRYFRNESLSPGELILQKLEEIGSSVKRVETLIEERQSQMPETSCLKHAV